MKLRPITFRPFLSMSSSPAKSAPATTRCGFRDRRAAGFTLIEILVATTLALALMAALMALFNSIGSSVNASQSAMESSGEMRSSAVQMSKDLDGLTTPTIPPQSPDTGNGYFEAGPNYLMFTTRNTGRPFTSRTGIQSDLAEVAWYISNGALHRRVMLVSPGSPPAADISSRNEGGQQKSNSLNDLAKRENRFAHGGGYPFAVSLNQGGGATDDVILNNVVSFDVKVYDPGADNYVVPGGPGAVTFAAGRSGQQQLTNVYDTWSTSYEIEQGTAYDGFDNLSKGVVDHPAERQFSAPYSTPLRGVQLTIRVQDPGTGAIRQVTVIQNFLPK